MNKMERMKKERDEKLETCKQDTLAHIRKVNQIAWTFICKFLPQCNKHDASKLAEPELSIFAEYGPKLKNSTYGSEEYEANLEDMGVAITHHYKSNTHHPEHYENGIAGMTIVDLVEMFCDWKAATLRHEDGDFEKSIRINAERFNMDPQLEAIFINSIGLVEKIQP